MQVDLDQLSGSCLGSLWGQMVAEAAVWEGLTGTEVHSGSLASEASCWLKAW